MKTMVIQMYEKEKILDEIHGFIVNIHESHLLYAQKLFEITNEYMDTLDENFDKIKEKYCPELLPPKPKKDENGNSDILKNCQIDLSSLGNLLTDDTTDFTEKLTINLSSVGDDGVAKTDEIPQG